MPPMGRARADEARTPTPVMARYYAQRATAGLIIAEGAQVSPFSVSRPGSTAIHSAAQVAGWRQVTDAVHAAGGRIFQQLSHHGRRVLVSRLPKGQWPVAPSPIAARGTLPGLHGQESFAVPQPLSIAGIKELIRQYGRAAINANDAGFDGVEVHAASALLIDQFLRDATNRRTDQYGGPIPNRARFLLEVIDEIAAHIGADRIGVRLSPHFHGDGIGDSDPAALFEYVARALGARKIAYLHLVEPAETPGDQRLAPLLRQAFGGPLILCGDLTAATAEQALGTGAADLAAFGRPFIANPDLVDRLRRGAAWSVAEPSKFYEGGEHGYVDYPALQEEEKVA